MPVTGDSETNSGVPNTGRNSSDFDPNASTFKSFSDIKSGLSNKGGNGYSTPNAPTFKSFSQMKSGLLNRLGNDHSASNAPPTFKDDRPMRSSLPNRGPDPFTQMNPGLPNMGGSGFPAPNASTYQNFTQTSLFKDGLRSGEKSNDMDFVRGVIEEDVSRRNSSVFSHFHRPNLETNADIIHIKMLRNNTFVTVTDSKGNVKCKATSGSLPDLKGGRKMSNYTADATAEDIGRRAKAMGLKSVVVKVNGFTHFKKKRKAIVAFRDGFTNSRSDLNPIVYIEDTTRKAHNGCRLPRKRRV